MNGLEHREQHAERKVVQLVQRAQAHLETQRKYILIDKLFARLEAELDALIEVALYLRAVHLCILEIFCFIGQTNGGRTGRRLFLLLLKPAKVDLNKQLIQKLVVADVSQVALGTQRNQRIDFNCLYDSFGDRANDRKRVYKLWVRGLTRGVHVGHGRRQRVEIKIRRHWRWFG